MGGRQVQTSKNPYQSPFLLENQSSTRYKTLNVPTKLLPFLNKSPSKTRSVRALILRLTSYHQVMSHSLNCWQVKNSLHNGKIVWLVQILQKSTPDICGNTVVESLSKMCWWRFETSRTSVQDPKEKNMPKVWQGGLSWEEAGGILSSPVSGLWKGGI